MSLDVDELYELLDRPDAVERPEQNIIERRRFDDALDVPIQLTDLDAWGNYVNDDLYEMDKKIREYLRGIAWRKYGKKRNGQKKFFRTTAPQVFKWIYGREATAGADGPACIWIHRLLKYYCTEHTGSTTYRGKRVGKVYKFSPTAAMIRGEKILRRPMSLRLRIEEAQEEAARSGKEINWDGLLRADPTTDKRARRRQKPSGDGDDENGQGRENGGVQS